MKRKILITGGQGYLGSLLSGFLEKEKFDVTTIDNGYFIKSLYGDKHILKKAAAREIRKDARDISKKDLEGFESVVHLAGISNDPMGKMHENDVYGPTREYATRLARMSKEMGIKFIFASSCSVYGIGGSELLHEESQVSPQTGYSLNKLQIEEDLKSLSDSSFSPIALRFATVYGPSPRIRFDVVVNMLAGMAVAQGKIVLNSDGLSWRPNLHILDLCESIRCCLEWEYNGGELMVLNVGDEKDNWSIIDIAREIHNAVPESKLSFLKENPELDTKGFIRDRKVQQSDTRTYRVSFAKIKKLLPKFRCRWNLTTGIPDLISWLQTNNLTEKDFLSRKYYRLQQLEYLIEKGKLTQDLRWKIPTYKKVR